MAEKIFFLKALSIFATLMVSVSACSTTSSGPSGSDNASIQTPPQVSPSDNSGENKLLSRLEKDRDFVNVSTHEQVKLDLRYATPNNFLKRDVYNGFNQCFLHRLAAEKIQKAEKLLSARKPGWRFLVFDCLRPRTIQREMWKIVEHTPQQPYVANPEKGSMHNFGFAVDLSLTDATGGPIDMGTPFDFFGPLAEPQKENQFLEEGKLSKEQIANRKTLRSIMVDSGFIQLPNEWWHFDALPRKDVQAKHRIVE